MANIEKYLPDRFKEIEEFENLCLAENPEFGVIEKRREKWLNNKFPALADLDGLKLYEKILDITPNSFDSVEDRRFRILSKLNERLPYTWVRLHRMIAAICGWDGYEMTLEDYILTVYLSLDSMSKTQAVLDVLRDVLPMNIFIGIEEAAKQFPKLSLYSYYTNSLDVTIVPLEKLRGTINVGCSLVSAIQAVYRVRVLPMR